MLDSVATQLRSFAAPGTKVLAQTADITDEASVATLFATAKKAVGKIDVLINSAGSLSQSYVGAAENAAAYFRDFDVNVRGSYLVTHHFLAQADGAGTVITLITATLSTVFPGLSSYTASKLAFVGILEHLHVEQPGIRVFMLIPGIVQTEMTLEALKPYAKDSAALSGSWTLFLSTPRAEWMRGGIVSVNCKPFLLLKIAAFLTED